jgi:hypothetical protein
MLADERDAAREIRVRQARHGDQEMIRERIGAFHEEQYPADRRRTQEFMNVYRGERRVRRENRENQPGKLCDLCALCGENS